MRSLFLILLSIASLTLNAQSLQQLDSVRSFKGVKFGKPLSNEILKLSTFELRKDDDRLYIDTMTNETRKYLTFLNEDFNLLQMHFTKKKEPYYFTLFYRLNSLDEEDIKAEKLPSKFQRLRERLINLFGKDYEIKEKDKGIFGNNYEYEWTGKLTQVAMGITYGSTMPRNNVIYIAIVDLKKQREVDIEEIKK